MGQRQPVGQRAVRQRRGKAAVERRQLLTRQMVVERSANKGTFKNNLANDANRD